ncbi:uncharacterized protein LOC125178761 [Hyalella azteca]|uniref:Uncharacterized protein LOC125178761 n=1 Tax=Hyalella azteca TaxID=294128 RepID=A0A979FRI4_HYAAZ|nr:uncharacterized protein LOC125178761 [Hyalella azteca]
MKCSVLTTIYGPGNTTSGGLVFRSSALSNGKKLVDFAANNTAKWFDYLNLCKAHKTVTLLRVPTTLRDANIVAARGIVAVDATKMPNYEQIFTHDSKLVDTSLFRAPPKYEFDVQHCLISTYFNLYWIACLDYPLAITTAAVCEEL